MKTRIYLSLKQKDVALILAALSFYEGYDNWFNDETDDHVKELKEKLNKKLITTIKLKKRKEDNLPF